MNVRRLLFALGSLVALVTPAFADAPGSIDVTCDVDRTQFRTAARSLSGSDTVTFRLWSDATPGAPDAQIGSDYTIALSALNVIKRYTDRYDHVTPRKSARVEAAIGSDESPVLLPVGGVAYVDLTVATTTLGCDNAATNSPTLRRRLQAAPFARESSHAETCDTCTTAGPPLVPGAACASNERLTWSGTAFVCSPEISARVHFTSDLAIAGATLYVIDWDSERWDTASIHNTSVNPSRLTAPVEGIYQIFCSVWWDSGGSGGHFVHLRHNGGTYLASQAMPAYALGPILSGVTVNTVYRLAAGEYLECLVNSESASSVSAGGFSSEFGLVKLN